jgi:thioredoxin 1
MTFSDREQWFSHEVLQSPTPVLVHFCAPWCGLCRVIEPVLQHFVREAYISLKLISINADDNLNLASQYRIKALPTVLLFKQGELLYRMEGIASRDEVASIVQTLATSVLIADD